MCQLLVELEFKDSTLMELWCDYQAIIHILLQIMYFMSVLSILKLIVTLSARSFKLELFLLKG